MENEITINGKVYVLKEEQTREEEIIRVPDEVFLYKDTGGSIGIIKDGLMIYGINGKYEVIITSRGESNVEFKLVKVDSYDDIEVGEVFYASDGLDYIKRTGFYSVKLGDGSYQYIYNTSILNGYCIWKDYYRVEVI